MKQSPWMTKRNQSAMDSSLKQLYGNQTSIEYKLTTKSKVRKKIIHKVPLEIAEHRALMKWVNLNQHIRDCFIHIPNEGKRTLMQGYVLKQLGMKSGVSDFFLAYPTKIYHGLWIEMKRLKYSKESLEQQQWITLMKKLGYAAAFCYGFEDAKETISTYLDNRIIA